MKIALFGQFGSGNSGNDGSLESMLIFLRQRLPEAELLCICSDPAQVEARFGVAAVSVSGRQIESRWIEAADRYTGHLLRRIFRLYSLISILEYVDCLIVPGTGILDDFQENPFGWPFVVFRWCVAAKLLKARIAFVSIGAGPVTHRLSRWFMKIAANCASYRSYRDAFSRDYMRDLGVNVEHDRRYPDIAFRLPVPVDVEMLRRDRWSVGVGVMHYRGWSKDADGGDEIYRTYLAKMTELVIQLLRDGHDVCLLTGDRTDFKAVEDISANVARTEPKSSFDRIRVGWGGTLQDIMRDVMQTDIAIVSRYHNAVCALKLGCPVISLGYARKNLDLLAGFEQQHYALNIDDFECRDVLTRFNAIRCDIDRVRLEISNHGATVQACLATQEDELVKWVNASRAPYLKPSTDSLLA